MPNKMLIDASHPEETRVVVVRGNRIEEFDFESQDKKQLKGNIYLARVTRVEPSLQAAFVEYGGNRTVSSPSAKSTQTTTRFRSPTVRRCCVRKPRKPKKTTMKTPRAARTGRTAAAATAAAAAAARHGIAMATHRGKRPTLPATMRQFRQARMPAALKISRTTIPPAIWTPTTSTPNSQPAKAEPKIPPPAKPHQTSRKPAKSIRTDPGSGRASGRYAQVDCRLGRVRRRLGKDRRGDRHRKRARRRA